MEDEHEQRVFNLQIQIQKLEEELTLFRNGASGQELFEVIGEKNTEISDLKRDLAAKTDNLKKLAKSSTDVISKYSALQDSFEQQKAEKLALEQLTTEQTTQIEELRQSYSTLAAAHQELEADCGSKQERICELEREVIDANVIIEKLHRRGAALVAEKTEKSKALDKLLCEKSEMEKKFQGDMAKLNNAILDANRHLEAEHAETAKAKKQYEESQKMIHDVREAITTAQRTNEIAKADMKKIQTSYEKKIEILLEKFEMMKKSKAEDEENLIKMKQDCEKLATSLSQQALRHAKEIQTREEHWLNEHKRIQKLSETAQIRVGRLEGEKETNITSRRECDILRAKNLELEEKNRRLEQTAKSRFLRDKTNAQPISIQDDIVGVATEKAGVTIIPSSAVVGSSVAELPGPMAPIFAMHHRAPTVAPNYSVRQGSAPKLHEPGCSINCHR